MRKFNIFLTRKKWKEYLDKCVSSILSQEYQNFVLYVLDNHSVDGTIPYIQSIRDERVILVQSEHCLSIEKNWARVLDFDADGFMTIIGHDDVLYPNFLSTINKLIDEFPDASLFITKFDILDFKGSKVRVANQGVGIVNANAFLRRIFNMNFDSFGTGYVFRASDYKKLNGIPMFKALLFADDALFASLTSISYLIIGSEVTFGYRQHKKSTSGSATVENVYESMIQFLQYMKIHMNHELNISLSLRMEFCSYVIFWCTWINLKQILSSKQLRTSNHSVFLYDFAKCQFPEIFRQKIYQFSIPYIYILVCKYIKLRLLKIF